MEGEKTNNNILEYFMNRLSDLAFKIRSLKKSQTGLQLWKIMKDKLPDSLEGITFQWSKHLEEESDLYYKWTKLLSNHPEYGDNKKIIEVNHFLWQLVNIANKKKPEFIRFAQIALNYGQAKAHINEFDNNIKELFENILSLHIVYIPFECVKTMGLVDKLDDIEKYLSYVEKGAKKLSLI